MDTMFQNVPWLNRTIHTTNFISSKADPCLPFSNLHVVLYLGDHGNGYFI